MKEETIERKRIHCIWMNRLRIFLPASYFLLPALSSAQITFERTYGGGLNDIGLSVQQSQDGGYIIAGSSMSFGAGLRDAYLIKTDSLGDTLWTRTFGGSLEDLGYSVKETQDGGYIIAGGTESFGAGFFDVYLVKTDSSGDTLWTRTFGGTNWDLGYSVHQTQRGEFVIVGLTDPSGIGMDDVYLIKTDSLGDTLWTKTYGGASVDVGYSVQETSDGGYIITGYTYSFGAGGVDVYLIKTDSLGDTLWTRTYGDDDDDVGRTVQQTSDGGYIIAGHTLSFGAGLSDVYLIKTDSLGDTLWTRTYGGTGKDFGHSVQQTSDGGYIITGQMNSFGAVGWAVYLIKTDSLGDTLWTKTYGGAFSDGGYLVQLTSD
ncbi:PQQ-like beta-propeller repeat protein, partial [candidate division TA06 bacterium]|nr:PQQ-like beta-propeller repeat protein [candidate division TA06 bacterium]